MPNSLDDATTLFLVSYEKYLAAKEQNSAVMTWLKAVQCRTQLQKMGGVSKEAEICENIFAAFVGKEDAAKIYRDLCDDSRSYPKT
jgi:hypothetical protein